MKRAILVIPDMIRREDAEAADTWRIEAENKIAFNYQINKYNSVWITDNGYYQFDAGEEPMTSWLVEIEEEETPAEEWINSTYNEPVNFDEHDMIKAFKAGQKYKLEQKEAR